MQDRPYQVACHQAIRKNYEEGVYHQLVAKATGTGKTVVFSQLPDRLRDLLPGKTMVLLHREELADQAIRKMRLLNPTLRIHKEMAEHHADPDNADVVVASVATLGRAGNQRLEKYDWKTFDKFIVDEAHHAIAPSYRNIYQAAGLLEPGDRRLLLGVTATPQRGDKQGLATLFEKITFTYSLRQAIEDGWLVEPRGYRVSTRTSLDGVKTVAGDYAQQQLADAVNTPERNNLIVKAWREHAVGLSTIAFTVDIQHAKDLAATFQKHGIAARAVWGDDLDRAAKLIAHQHGVFPVITNCGVLTEGYDDPNVTCIILARPTKSNVLFTQMVGRATRLSEGCDNLLTVPREVEVKRFCIILDVVDASSHHSLVTLPTLMGMPPGLNLNGKGLVESVKALEEAQARFPHLDFSALRNIDDLEAHIEEIDLFNVKYPPEVEANSQFIWHPSPSGGYVLLLPNKEFVHIQQNLLDKWEIFGIIKQHRYRGERDTMAEAFSAADKVVRNNCGDALKILSRQAFWHHDPATEAQVRALTKMFKGKTLPPDLNKGMASKLISSYLAGRA